MEKTDRQRVEEFAEALKKLCAEHGVSLHATGTTHDSTAGVALYDSDTGNYLEYEFEEYLL